MENYTPPSQYLIAEGPEGLAKVLNNLLIKAQEDISFAAADHYILYQLNLRKHLLHQQH